MRCGVSADALFCKAETTGSQPCDSTEVPPCRANVNTSGVGDITLSILEGADLGSMSGGQLYLSYGASADEMISTGRFRITYRVP